MDLKNILEDQMASPLRLLIVVFAPLLILVALILGYSFYSILLTSIALLLSSIFFTYAKQKPILLEKVVEDGVEVVLESDNGSVATQESHIQEASMKIEAPKYLVAPQSSCLDDLSSSEDSELLDWPFGDNVDQSSPDFSDGSISDEESLIEISLPGGHYVDHDKEEESIFSMQQKISGVSQKAIFQQHALFEFLAEINEEENMIEIDISMGSIKCSRFEVHA